MNKVLMGFLAIAAFTLGPSVVQAAVITYGFTGEVDYVGDVSPPNNNLPDAITTNSTVVGYFTYDDAAPDDFPADDTIGVYRGPEVSLYILVDGTYDFQGSLGFLTTGGASVFDNNTGFFGNLPPFDAFSVGLNPDETTAHSAFDPNVVSTALSVTFESSSTSVLSSDAILGLLLEDIPLTAWDLTLQFGINAYDETVCQTPPCVVSTIEGTITSLWRVVPEPITLPLIGIGLAGIGFARKKKQS